MRIGENEAMMKSKVATPARNLASAIVEFFFTTLLNFVRRKERQALDSSLSIGSKLELEIPLMAFLTEDLSSDKSP